MKLFLLGIKDGMTSYMKSKIMLTNQVALMSAFIGSFYSFFIYADYVALAIYPILLIFTSSGLLAMNYFGFIQTSRFLASFQMLVLASLFHASILEASDTILLPFFSSMFAMTFIPWLLYSLREKALLITTSAICYGLLLSQGFLNSKIELPSIDPTFFRESYLNPMTYFFAFGIAALLLIMNRMDKSNKLTT